jgi:hypothetical protein
MFQQFLWTRRLVVVAAATLFVSSPAPAQLMVNRSVWPLTHAADSGVAGLLPRLDFLGEAQRGFGSADDELAWDIRNVGLLELWRWRNSQSPRLAPYTSLIAIVGHQLNANPHNSIGFNPRGAAWEENLLLVRHHQTFEWHVGAFHRCRHEIDNTHAPDETRQDPAYEPTERLLSLTGFQAGVSVTFDSSGTWRWRGMLRVERYAQTTDNRVPRNTAAPYWKDAVAAVAGGMQLSRPAGDQRRFYSGVWGALMVFSSDGRTAGEPVWRGEIGVQAAGHRGGVTLFTAVEQTFDDVSRPTPQRSRVVAAGVRFQPVQQ